MKTTVKVSAIIFMALVLSTKAQLKVNNTNNNSPRPGTNVPRGGNLNNSNSNSNANAQFNQGNQNNWSNGNSDGSITIAYGNYPKPGWGYGAPAYGYYGNPHHGYSIKKAAKYSLNASGAMIHQAVDFNNWNDIYSPILANAIRHHNYARQLYWWGNYDAVIHHAERARYLAWHSLQYFQNPDCYNGGFGGGYYQNPNGDPNNPYYKNGNANNKTQNNFEGEGSKKQGMPEGNEIDKKLPDQGTNDKELIRSFDKSKDE